ncbi:MAG: pseudouridine synthase [Phototrophicaceae bacterium]|jgi:pseudouridine synthase
MQERVQKLMAQANIGSRRVCEEMIEKGRVKVNGRVIHLGDKADPAKDKIEVDGVKLHIEAEKLYIAIHKPLNVLSTNEGHRGDDRQTIRELLPFEGHFFSIGRLDAESTGLMVLTNDGELANRLSHPRYRHTKTYKVQVYGLPPRKALDEWQEGIYLEDGKTAPCIVRVVRGNAKISVLEVTMTEGKNRQIRRVASELGYPVHKLTRIAIGRLELGTLEPGSYRVLTEQEVNMLKTPSPDFQFIKDSQSKQRPFKGVKQSPVGGDGQSSDTDEDRPARGRGRRPANSRYKPVAADATNKPRRVGTRKPLRPGSRPSADDDRKPTRDDDRKPARPSGGKPGTDDDHKSSRPGEKTPRKPSRNGNKPARPGSKPTINTGRKPSIKTGNKSHRTPRRK